eukprot:CAMPEP_0115528876 /NCGR_PEP_ID=MMETSP0271-20121206/83626_1 /TAXON_ID=71861 /ORGANISM="Scrippsiella trochoidea, Strain CCMP3099" /LENGTH=56 /DNA_ID=CAMNT_0002960829 /DNA_START=261 /DNA_END=431 /DNA_ORIENTATION=-
MAPPSVRLRQFVKLVCPDTLTEAPPPPVYIAPPWYPVLLQLVKLACPEACKVKESA